MGPTTAEIRKVAAEAVIGPEITGPAPAGKEKIKNLQEKRAESPRAGTEELASAEPIDPSKVSESERNYVYKDKDGNDQVDIARQGRENTAVAEMIDLLDNGNVTPAHIDKFLEGAMSVPEAKVMLDALQTGYTGAGLSPDVKDALKRIAENPILQQQLREKLNGALDTPVPTEDLGAKERALEEADRKVKSKNKQLTDAGRELTDKTAELEEFDPGKPKANRLRDLKNDAPTITRTRDLYRSQQDADNTLLSTANARLDKARADIRAGRTPKEQPIDIQAEISDIGTRMGAREALIKPLQDQLDEFDALKSTKERLTQEVETTVPNKIDTLTGELSSLNEAKFAAQADLENATNTFNDALEKRAKMFEDMIAKETADFLQKEIAHTVTLEKKNLQEAKDKAEAAGDKHALWVLNGLGSRWDSVLPVDHRIIGHWKKDTETRADPAKVRPDLDTLIASGPEGLIRNMFIDHMDTTTTPPTPVYRVNPDTGIAYSQVEVDAKIADPEFMQGVSVKASERLVAKALEAGVLTHADASAIVAAFWGENIISNASNWNKQAAEQLAAACKAAGGGDNPLAWAIEQGKKHPSIAAWLLMLFLMPGVGTIVGTIALSKEVLGKKPHPESPAGAT